MGIMKTFLHRVQPTLLIKPSSPPTVRSYGSSAKDDTLVIGKRRRQSAYVKLFEQLPVDVSESGPDKNRRTIHSHPLPLSPKP